MTYFSQPRYIVFAGVDGSGKSTQAAKLNRYLQSKGISTFLLENNNEVNIQRLNALAGPKKHGRFIFGNDLYELAKFFDFSNDMDSYVRPLISNGMSVIAPRCIVTMLARATVLGSSIYKEHQELLSLLPIPDLIIRINIDAKESSKRVEKRGKDIESIEYLKQLECAIENLSSEYEMVTVDGNFEPDTVHREIVNLIESQ